MALLYCIEVKEEAQMLSKVYRQAPVALRPRIKMLQLIKQGICSTKALAHRTRVATDSIAQWKKRYAQQGIEALTEEKRGSYQRGALNAEQHVVLQKRLSDPKERFTSYKEAMAWLKETFGLKMNYQAVNKYVKRNFHTKLKLGRKTHVKKDPTAEATFKKV